MDRTGISGYEQSVERIITSLNLFGYAETQRYESKGNKQLEKHLERTIQVLKNGIVERSPFLSLELEKHCINFERAFFAPTTQEQKRYDKQLSELQSAKFSAQLVFEPERYRQHVEDAYGPNRKIMFPPAGETCVTALQKQIQQLARPKVGIVSPTIKEFYSIRQQNLRCALDLCIEAQCKALDIPVPKQGKTKSLEL